MKESAERIQYIVEYIVSYKAKIEALNKKGLFDTATLYEIFAQKICELWFGQKFLNLNIMKANYPYVDLISEDRDIVVQVSTTQNIPTKVKSTLEKIRDTKSKDLQKVKKLFFFVLANDSVGRVQDYTGLSRIGNIDFKREENLITSDDVIQKAKTDIEFQIALYDSLQNENDSLTQIADKFETAVMLSRALIKNNIDCSINNEYVIDRSKEIERIRNENLNFISIQGEAGSGKSALCRIMLENEELLLYARAEKFSEAQSLEDIWKLDLNKLIEYINQKKLTIYIDALEFIADSSKTKLDILQQMYEIAKGHNNIYIVNSCRTSDRSAFVKIENIYKIKRYDVSLLSNNQILDVAARYKIVQELWDAKCYMQLLRSPFYLNLIIKTIKDLKRIDDVDGFRNIIWDEVICLGGRKLPQGLTHSDIKRAVEKIVFDRAKGFRVGVRKGDIGKEVVDILLSENIVTQCSNDSIRLKYDIFEDICFERFIDEQYDDCKNDYDKFFSRIEPLGRCIYRRYQIWVENKLLSKGNREKFLFKLLETDRIPTNWKIQTIVGIVKSNFCSEFFEEYGKFLSGDLFWEFVRLTNNFAFEVSIRNLKYNNVYSKLKPIGMGRVCLINLIYDQELYKDNCNERLILKLCSDYSQGFLYNNSAIESACMILEFYVEQKKLLNVNSLHLDDELNECLLPIYRMAGKSKKWIKQFWSECISDYLYIKGTHWLNKNIIKYVLNNTVPALALYLPQELCEIADAYWIKNPEYNTQNIYSNLDFFDSTEEYGLSENAESYIFDYAHVTDNMFLNILIKYNWRVAFLWLINLTNYVADFMKNSSPKRTHEISVWDDSPENKKSFIYSTDFWLVGIQENRVNELIGDGIYLFTKMAIGKINDKNNDKKSIKEFSHYIKSEIIKKANNIMMLSVIAEIGRNCENVIPGYSLFLASSIELVMLDSKKISILSPSEEMHLYERLMFMASGIPSFDKRYDIEVSEDNSLQSMVIKSQLTNESLKYKAEKILDYLYSIIPNHGKYAQFHLQIQKMDLRNASMSCIDERTVAIIPEIRGNAKKIVEENSQSKYNKDKDLFHKIIVNCNSLIANEKFGLKECIDAIDQLQILIKNSDAPGQFQKTLVEIIAYALSKDGLTVERRSELCDIWLDGIESIFKNGVFAFDFALLKILYQQIENELTVDIRKKMKRQMLECLLYRGQQGIIFNISMQLKNYLRLNDKLSQCIFNTIVAISEDKMENYHYNVSKLNEIGHGIDYLPNRKKPPIWVKETFCENRIDLYKSNKESIINTYLFQEKSRDYADWNIENCDIQTLCYISNCGLNFNNKDFNVVMRTMFGDMISIISTVENYRDYLHAYAISEVVTFINNSLTSSQNSSAMIDMLFGQLDFAKFNSDAYELYEYIAKNILIIYFDGYNDAKVRQHCEIVIKGIENKISNINNEEVRNKLSSMMFLTLGKFGMVDLEKLNTSYSYRDKIFLNTIWKKYGWLHFDNLLYVINQIHITELLPEVLVSLDESLQKYRTNFSECERSIQNNNIIINKIITKAFLDFNDKIKEDYELAQAFEGFLQSLIEFNMEEAAVILDEFRVH